MIHLPNATSALEIRVNVTPLPARNSLWRDLYLQAIFEPEHAKVPARLQEAERALIRREHELCNEQVSSGEREAIINALHCLDALRRCSKTPRGKLAAWHSDTPDFSPIHT